MHSYLYIFCIQSRAENPNNNAGFNRFNLTVKALDLDEEKLNQIYEGVTLYKIS